MLNSLIVLHIEPRYVLNILVLHGVLQILLNPPLVHSDNRMAEETLPRDPLLRIEDQHLAKGILGLW